MRDKQKVPAHLRGAAWHKPFRDPMADDVTHLFKLSNLPMAQVARKTGISPKTIKRLVEGVTRQPHPSTLRFIARACGHEMVLRRIGSND